MVGVEVLKAIPFFDVFSEEHLQVIAPQTLVKTFKTNEYVLEQETFNLNLYFLLEGAIDIFVDEKRVATSRNSGQVFGEMSIVNHSTCTATIQTKEPCSFLVLNFEDLKQSVPKHVQDVILKNFYQSCAEILVKKLIMTNSIGKTFGE